MALAERRDIKDYIGIYYTFNWKLLNVFFFIDNILILCLFFLIYNKNSIFKLKILTCKILHGL
jgi:hypothetical protein